MLKNLLSGSLYLSLTTSFDTFFTTTLSSQASWKGLSPRFARHFVALALDTPHEASLQHVFATLVEPAWPRQSRAQTRAATARGVNPEHRELSK